jgi:hypothetical protein
MNANKILGFAFIVTSAGATALADVPVLSVCEVLDSRLAYNGKIVIVVGRVVRTMEGEWLDQECGQKLVIDGFGWPYSISLSYYFGRPPKPPPAKPPGFQWNASPLLEKLKEVQKTTKITLYPQLRYSEEWAAVFGRLDTLEKFPPSYPDKKRPYGFGNQGGGPAQLVWPHNGIYYQPDALEPPQRDDESVVWRIVKRELRKPSGPDYFSRSIVGTKIPSLIGTVIDSSPPGHPDTLIVSLSADNIPEATLKLDHRLKRDVPTGEIVMFEGVATDFSQAPFMLVFQVVAKQRFFVLLKPPKPKSDAPWPY